MTPRQLIPAAAATALLTLPALANDRLEEVIVTSSRIEMPLRQVGTSVSVMTAEDIQALHEKVVGTSPVGHTLSRAVPVKIELS